MSRGPGRIQRAILAAFDAEPARRFTVRQLAEIAFERTPASTVDCQTTYRALITLAPKHGLVRCRVTLRTRLGWHHVWGRQR